jgi:hypothetical protein
VIGVIATIRSIRFGLAVGAITLIPAMGLLAASRRKVGDP